MKRARHLNSTLILLVILAVFVTPGAAQTTITYYMATGQDDWTAWSRETVKAFEAQHPDIRVEVLMGNLENLLAMVASGITVDVIHTEGSRLPEFAHLNLFRPLDDLIANDPDFDLDAYFPAIIETMKWKGKIYGLPRAWSAVATVYNRDIFDMAGVLYPDETWTWDDLVNNGKKLVLDRNGDGHAEIYAFFDTWANANRFPIWIWQAGGDIWNEDFTRVRIAEEASLQGLQFYYDLYFTHHIAPQIIQGRLDYEPGLSIAGQDDLFRRGHVAMVSATRYFTPDEVSWDVAPLPQGPAGRHSALIPSLAGISPYTENLEAAWEFLKFFTSPEGFLAGDNLNPMRSVYLGAIPPQIDLARDRLSQRTDVNELMWLYAGEIGRIVNVNNPFAGIDGRSELTALLNSVARQEQPLDTAIRELAARWQRAVDQTL